MRPSIPQLDADALGVSAGLADFEPRQPYRLVFFGEKTSLEDVLGPLAEEFSADLYLMGGQISDTYLHQMAKDAAADGRPLVVFTFSDCDPAGYWDMPTVIGRKLQALRDLKFPSLEFTVVHAALSPEQASGLDLPSSPLKEGEGRAAVWEATYNIAQIEIDALATLQPDELERIAREAIAPYFDTDLAERVRAAYAAWRERASEEIAAQVDEERLDALRVRANAALEELRAVNGELAEIASEVTVSEPPALPEPDMDSVGGGAGRAPGRGVDRQRHGLRRGHRPAPRPQREGRPQASALPMIGGTRGIPPVPPNGSCDEQAPRQDLAEPLALVRPEAPANAGALALGQSGRGSGATAPVGWPPEVSWTVQLEAPHPAARPQVGRSSSGLDFPALNECSSTGARGRKAPEKTGRVWPQIPLGGPGRAGARRNWPPGSFGSNAA